MEQKMTSLETLFKEGFGLDWKQMAIGEAVDVSDKNVFVSSYSHEENKEVQAKVLKAVRKPDAKKCVFYTEGKRMFDGSPDHKVWAKLHLDKDAAYFTAKQLSKKTFYLFNGKDWKASSVEITKELIPILDVEIENTHNYFSNGVLSHNTIYGNPETTTGGNALKFYASIRFTIRRKENVIGMNSDDIIGIISTLKSIKNKVAPPFKTCDMKLIFGKGYQVEEEYVTAFVKRSLVTKSGSWYSWTYKDLNGKECAGKEQGLDNVTQWFKDNPVVFEQMKKKIQDMVAKESAVVTEKEENEEEVIKQQTKLEKEEFADLHTSETSKPEDLAAQALAATETK